MQCYKFHSDEAWAYNFVSAELAEAHNTKLGLVVGSQMSFGLG